MNIHVSCDCASDEEDHSEKAKVAWKGHAKKNVRCTSTRKETENQVERLVKKRYVKCGVKGGG